jgi:hypothetical protein
MTTVFTSLLFCRLAEIIEYIDLAAQSAVEVLYMILEFT